MVGHIAHVNLRSEALEYKYLIGEVILVKNKKALKTVVNKVSSIENVYRTFPLEVAGCYVMCILCCYVIAISCLQVLAGDTDLEVTLKECLSDIPFGGSWLRCNVFNLLLCNMCFHMSTGAGR